jgi:hypothetical protein
VVVASTGKFRVDMDALAPSASHVAGQGEDLASAHLSDNRIVAAQSGSVEVYLSFTLQLWEHGQRSGPGSPPPHLATVEGQ